MTSDEATDIERFTEAGLYDPDAPDAEKRLALLRLNLEHGVTLEEMIVSRDEGRLALLRGGASTWEARPVFRLATSPPGPVNPPTFWGGSGAPPVSLNPIQMSRFFPKPVSGYLSSSRRPLASMGRMSRSSWRG